MDKNRVGGMWPIAFGFAVLALFVVSVLWRKDVKELKAAAAGVEQASMPRVAAAPSSTSDHPITKVPAARKAWEEALAGAVTSRNEKTDGEGVTTFTACFDAECGLKMNGSRDAFRKLRHFTVSSGPARNILLPHSEAYVALPDCKRPIFYLALTVVQKDWLFARKVAVMVDGELTLERDFEAKRDQGGGYIIENVDLVLRDSQIDAMRKAVAGNSVIVRITGDKGYVSLDAQAVRALLHAASTSLAAYDRLDKATGSKTSDAGCV